MADGASAIAVVAPAGDGLSEVLADSLEAAGRTVVRPAPERVAGLPATITGSSFRLAGRAIGAIFYRVSPDAAFASDFAREDRGFSGVEARSIWAAAMQLDGLLSINRLEPWAWFGSAGWGDWRCALTEAGLSVAPFKFGDLPDEEERRWQLYHGAAVQRLPSRATRRILGTATTAAAPAHKFSVVFGIVVDGEPPDATDRLVGALGDLGLNVASVTTDGEGRVMSIDPLPRFGSPRDTQRAANLIEQAIDTHLSRR